MKHYIESNPSDPTEEAATIRRLNTAGGRTDDDETKAVAAVRAIKLAARTGIDLSTVNTVFGFDQYNTRETASDE